MTAYTDTQKGGKPVSANAAAQDVIGLFHGLMGTTHVDIFICMYVCVYVCTCLVPSGSVSGLFCDSTNQ